MVKQQSKEWFDSRLGKFTSSQIHRLMTDPRTKAAKEKGELSQGAKTYILECVGEMLTGERAKEFSSAVTDWGNWTEDKARHYYELETGHQVHETSYHPINDDSGASPDGIVYTDTDVGNFEIKCPDTAAQHLKYFLMESLEPIEGGIKNYFKLGKDDDFKSIAKEYYFQVQCAMAATGHKWCDFVSFRPDLPMESIMIIFRVSRNEAVIKKMLERIDKAATVKHSLYETFVFGNN